MIPSDEGQGLGSIICQINGALLAIIVIDDTEECAKDVGN